MRKSINLVCAQLLLGLLAICGSASAQNLVANGSAELYSVSGMRPDNWQIVSGSWSSALPAGLADAVYDGTYLFYEGGDAVGVLQQDIDVAGYSAAIDASAMNFTFAGYVQSYPQGPGTTDQTRIVVTCLNDTKSTVLHTFDSDTMCSMAVWTRVESVFTAPPSTRYVRIELIASKRAGLANDGLFDAISLYAVPVGVKTVARGDAIKLYPNPATNTLLVKNAADAALTLTDVTGRIWLTQQVVSGNDAIDISRLPAGVYAAHICDAVTGLLETRSLVKQ